MSSAPGFVHAAQVEYRNVSRKWHKFLGFGTILAPRCENKDANKGPCKRKAEEEEIVEIEMEIMAKMQESSGLKKRKRD